MARFGLCGGFYTAVSVNADAQKCVNRYSELMGDDSKSRKMLLPAPGTAVVATPVDTQNVNGLVGRGIYTFRGRTFLVSGGTLYELPSNGTPISRGTVAHDGLPASFEGNGANQLAIAAGGNVYVLNLGTNVLTQATGLNGPVSMLGYVDGYFVALLSDSGTFQVSGFLDGTSWPGVQADAVSVFADKITTMIIDHRELIVGGPKQAVGYYDSGSANILDVIPGSFMEIGAAALWGRAKLDNTAFWWSADERGGPMAWRAQGYQPTRVSTHPIEAVVQGYSTWSDVICYAFQLNGHTFFHSYFPSANNGCGASWRYDVSTNDWHEVDFTDPSTGLHYAHRSMSHAYAYNKHLVQDWKTGQVLEMSDKYYNDFGNAQIRVRRAPHISQEQEWVFHSSLQIDWETGIGAGIPAPSSYPAQIFVADPSGQVWQITINDDTTLNYAAFPSTLPASDLYLNDYLSVGDSYKLTITFNQDNQPVISTVKVPSQNFPLSYLMATVTFQNSGLLIGNGQIEVMNPTAAVRDPQAVIRWSDDGGHSWTDGRTVNLGQTGQTKKRVIIRRLGRSRDRVYEVMDSDNFPSRIVDAYLKASPGYQPVERLTSQLRKGA